LVYDNILIAKLRENQEIYIEIFAERGIGKKHAKWSPVSTCFYRLMPVISIEENFDMGKNGEKLVGCCPAGVFEKKKGKVVVAKPRDCTTCRECIKLDGISLGKVGDHFICTNLLTKSPSNRLGFSLLKRSSCVRCRCWNKSRNHI
jgi:DNA-directed RNA polymerases I and III subunit RPAC1